MGGTVYITDPWMVDFYGINVGKYTSHMDPMGYINGTIITQDIYKL